MRTVDVIDDAEAAIVAMDPVRSRLLAELTKPGSATTLAKVLGLPRQKVNYHLRALEARGLVELVEERPRRGLVERVVRASASSYLVSPAALGPAAGDLRRSPDKLAGSYLVALAARAVREVGSLLRKADAAGKPLATLAIDADIRFRSAAERAAFTEDLTHAVTTLASHYHDESAPGGRWHRLVVLAHPSTQPPATPKETIHD
jgi:DNA-binding transcriptional ArsR family regulator